MIENWVEFEQALLEVDWQEDRYEEHAAPLIESLLAAVFKNPAIYQGRVRQILEDRELFASLEPYIEYPRTLMDKFTIYVAPDDLFRVRLHRFWPTSIAGNAIEKVHYHKWHMSTLMLSGEYQENLFDIDEFDEEEKFAQLSRRTTRTVNAGDTNSLSARSPHQVHNPAVNEPALTLFVRGPAVEPNARIFDVERSTYYDTFSPRPQIRHALSRLSEGDDRFHPMIE